MGQYSKSGGAREHILGRMADKGRLWPAAGRHTYSELGRVGLSTSRSGSLEFMLGCKLLLELRMLFAFEETTDSKLELMRLFLCIVVRVAKLCLFCDPMVCSLPASSVHGIFQVRILHVPMIQRMLAI